jgi:hypothetical protein
VSRTGNPLATIGLALQWHLLAVLVATSSSLSAVRCSGLWFRWKTVAAVTAGLAGQ